MKKLRCTSALVILLATLGIARAETRVALVIGNGAYQNVPRLANPPNDAEDVAASLRRDGFETMVATNLDKAAMDEITIKFAKAARNADVALFYYSGHALQFANINYLAPIDTKLMDEADLRRMVRLDDIVSDLQQAKNLRILVLDSCRDNPLADELKRSIGITRALPLQRGLAKIEAPLGMIVAYATQAGRTADDGDGRNSPYTAAFLKNIGNPEEIGTVFRRISTDVYESTKHRQLPELSLSITGEFYFHGKVEVNAQPAVENKPQTLPDSSFKVKFEGKIEPPEFENYFVIHDNVVARKGPNENEDGVFRLHEREQLRALARYESAFHWDDTKTINDLQNGYGDLNQTWIKVVRPTGELGFIQEIHLLPPNGFEAWADARQRSLSLKDFFDRAAKENSGPFASFTGVYCFGQTCNVDPKARWQLSGMLGVRYLIWFEASTMHVVNIKSAVDQIGTLQPDKLITFTSKESPWNGMKNLLSYKVTYQTGQSDAIFAFTKTHIFDKTADGDKYFAMVKAPNLQMERQYILNDYVIAAAEQTGRIATKRPRH